MLEETLCVDLHKVDELAELLLRTDTIDIERMQHKHVVQSAPIVSEGKRSPDRSCP